MVMKRLFSLDNVKPGDVLVDAMGNNSFVCRNETGYFAIDAMGSCTQSFAHSNALVIGYLDHKAFRIVNGPRRHIPLNKRGKYE